MILLLFLDEAAYLLVFFGQFDYLVYEGESTNTTRILKAINNADISDNNNPNPNTNTNINTNTNTISNTYSIFGCSSSPCTDAQELNISRSPPLGLTVGVPVSVVVVGILLALWYIRHRKQKKDAQSGDGPPPVGFTCGL